MKKILAIVCWTGLIVPAWAMADDAGPASRFAVVVGVSRSVLPSKSADLDARAVGRWLVDVAKWPTENVVVLTSEPGPGELRSTLANIQAAMADRIAPRIGRDDVLLVYFAGQAPGLPAKPKAKSTRMLDRLIPADFDDQKPDGSAWYIQESLEAIAGKHSPMILTLLDTSTFGRGIAIRKDSVTGDRLIGALTRLPRMSAWIASVNRVAPETPEGSPFRMAVLDALGTASEPRNLNDCLARLRSSAALQAAGFEARGGLPTEASVWRTDRRRRDLRVEPLLQQGHSGTISSLLFTTEGSLISGARSAVGRSDSTVRLWNLGRPAPEAPPEATVTPELARVYSEPIGGIAELARSPDGRWLAAGAENDGQIWLWDLQNQTIVPRPASKGAKTFQLGFLAGSRGFATVRNDGRVMLHAVDREADRELGQVKARATGQVATAPHGESVSLALISLVDGRIRLFDPRGVESATLAPRPIRAVAIGLSSDGRSLAVAGPNAIELLDLTDPRSARSVESIAIPAGEIITRIVFHGRMRLAVASTKRLRLFDVERPAKPRIDCAFSDVRSLAFSDDGRWLGAVEREGKSDLRVWRVDDAEGAREFRLKPAPMPDPGPGRREANPPTTTALAFADDGRRVAVGLSNGSIRVCSIDPGRAESGPPAVIPPGTLQVQSASVASDGDQFLLHQSNGRALLWDLVNREVRVLPYVWKTIRFMPTKGHRVVGVLSTSEKITSPFWPRLPENSMDGSVLTQDTILDDGESFELIARPETAKGLRLASLSGSIDGDWLASGVDPRSKDANVVLWNRPLQGGKTDQFEAFGDGKMLGVEFFSSATKGTSLVVRTDRDLMVVGPLPRPNRTRFPIEGDWKAMAVSRSEPFRVAVGAKSGEVFVWEPSSGGPPRKVASLPGPIEAVGFVAKDGQDRWLVASGREKRFHAWDINTLDVEWTVEPDRNHHDEILSAIVPWPNLPMILTTSVDSTVRLWNIETKKLVGTLTANPEIDNDPDAIVPWIASTADGKFDGSPEARSMVRLVRDGETFGLDDRVASTLFSGDVSRNLHAARAVEPRPRLTVEPPSIVLSKVDDPAASPRQITIDVKVNPGEVENLRVYRNNLFCPATFDRVAGSENHYRAKVTLLSGRNSLHVMAGRPGTADGQSNPIEDHLSLETAGRLHVVAIGVDTGSIKQPLRYASADAQSVAERFRVLNAQAPDESRGRYIPLTNEEVSLKAVNQVFNDLQIAVAGHPEDTVVLFVAGHTEFRNEDLLLKLASPPNRPEDSLRFAVMFDNLTKNLEATKRLVIIDGCQTEQIENAGDLIAARRRERRPPTDDPAFSSTRWIFAKSTNSAFEHDEIRHGMLTYVLLCGLADEGIPRPERLDAALKGLLRTSAANERTNRVDSQGLQKYVNDRLGELGTVLASDPDRIVFRGFNQGPRNPSPRNRNRPRVLCSAETLTPIDLVRLPDPNKAGAAR